MWFPSNELQVFLIKLSESTIKGREPTSPLNLLKENFILLILLITLKELLASLVSEPVL